MTRAFHPDMLTAYRQSIVRKKGLFGRQNHEDSGKPGTDLPDPRRAVCLVHVVQGQLPSGCRHHYRNREAVGGGKGSFSVSGR
jgi:hypothetical protein